MASPALSHRYFAGQERSRPLEVLSLGLSRTGTASIAQALKILGYGNCAHGLQLLDDPSYAAQWEKAIDGYQGRAAPFTRSDWDELLGHCGAVTDMPCTMVWRELYDAYPDAKVIIVQRDVEKWYQSFSEGVIDPIYAPSGKFTRNYVEPLLGSRLGALTLKCCEGYFGATSAEAMKLNARRVYEQHYRDIRATVGREKLLDYQLGSGWEPLCAFLGVDVPNTPFPWINEADALQAKIEGYKAQKLRELCHLVLQRVLPVLGVTLSVFFAWRWASSRSI